MPQRNYSGERAEVAKPNKGIILPIAGDSLMFTHRHRIHNLEKDSL
jgi:hypothetical protein